MEFSSLLLSLIAFCAACYYFFVKRNYWKDRGIPCVDGRRPLIGHMWPVVSTRGGLIGMYEKFYNSHPDRSMIGFYNFQSPTLLIRDPELVKSVLLSSFQSFHRNTASLDSKLDPLLYTNPFFTYGEEWKSQRSALLGALSSRNLKTIALKLENVCSQFSEYLSRETKVKSQSLLVDAQELLSRFTAEVVATSAFSIHGKSFSGHSDSFHSMAKLLLEANNVSELVTTVAVFYPTLRKFFGARIVPKELNQYFRQIIRDVLASRGQSCVPTGDFLQQIVESQKAHDKIDENFVTGHAVSFFLDGYLTSSVTMSFAMYQIAAHPEVQEKLREEVVEIFNNHDGRLTYDAINDMKYMEQVISESMRLFPGIGYLGRRCTEEYSLVGADGLECRIQPGTEVIIPVLGLHRDPRHWENPDIFDPDRFSDERKKNFHKFVYLPFGSGPRTCVGMRVALMQTKAALATLLREYSLEVDSKTRQPVEINPLASLFTAPKDKLWIRIKPL